MDQAELTNLLRIGADGAAAELIDDYSSRLYNYSLSLLSDPAQAQKATVAALLAAVDLAGSLADPARLELWLLALTRNECLRIRRVGQSDQEPDPEHDPDQHAGRAAEVAELIHVHGLDHRGVAAVLGISVLRARRIASQVETAGPDDVIVVDPAPPTLGQRVRSELDTPGRAAHRGDVARPLRRSGFPVPLDAPSHRRRLVMAASVAAGVLLVATVHALPPGDRTDVKLSAGKPSEGRAPQIELTVAPTVSVPASGILSPSPSSSPSLSPSRTPSPSPSAGPATPAPAPGPVAPPRRAPQPPTGQFLGIFGHCVEVAGSGAELHPCNGGPGQSWTAAFDGTLRAFGQCLMPVGGGTADRTRVVLSGCNGSDAQRWFSGPSGSVRNSNSGTCLDGPNNRNDPKQLEIWHCTGEAYQRWDLPG
jgi:hypothetical protein